MTGQVLFDVAGNVEFGGHDEHWNVGGKVLLGHGGLGLDVCEWLLASQCQALAQPRQGGPFAASGQACLEDVSETPGGIVVASEEEFGLDQFEFHEQERIVLHDGVNPGVREVLELC